jgi:acetate kinase
MQRPGGLILFAGPTAWARSRRRRGPGLAAVLGGIDAVVFTAGIGERSAEIRRRICETSAWLGIALDPAANGAGANRITTPHSKVSACVIPTNEEL